MLRSIVARARTLALAVLAVLAASGFVHAQNKAWVVAPALAPGVDFTTVQAAIDAAANGDTVLIQPGTYSGFTVDAKSLAIVGNGVGASLPQFSTAITVRNIGAGGTVLLRRLASGAGTVRLVNSQGCVVVEEATIAKQLQIEQTAAAFVVRASVTGGVSAIGSSVSVYDSTVRNDATFSGPALALTGTTAFVSGTSCTGGGGGFGGTSPIGCCYDGPPGGAGLVLTSSQCYALASTFVGGSGGFPGSSKLSFCPTCVAGSPGPGVAGSGLVTLPGAAHSFQTAPASEGQSLAFTSKGVAGEHVFLLLSAQATPQLFLLWSGTLLPNPQWVVLPLGVAPASGQISGAPLISELGPGIEAVTLWGQALHVHPSSQGPDFLSSPSAVVLLDKIVGKPDCNANGIDDAVDIATGASLDCNGNGVPDSCELDCNGNGVPDDCDIAAGTSVDADSDGTPDSCEQQLIVPSAAYPKISVAIAAAADGDDIVLLDGTFSGAGNKNLSLLGKRIGIRSLNGPQACILDLQGNGRAFSVVSGEPKGTYLRGLTIRNGTLQGTAGAVLVDDGSLRIESCEFVDCTAIGTGAAGGALYIRRDVAGDLPIEVRDCVFRGNRTPGANSVGGAICVARFAPVPFEVEFSNCEFRANSSDPLGSGVGGAVYVYGGESAPALELEVRNCAFVENAANRVASALALYSKTDARVTGCTFADNVLQGAPPSGGGGAIAVADALFVAAIAQLVVQDTLLWGNASPHNAQMWLQNFCNVSVSFSLIEGGAAGIAKIGSGATVNLGAGILAVDPLLAPADWHIGAASPCIDAGDPAFVPLPGELDLDGEPRVMGPRVDIGADERAP